jgi:ribonuclease III
LSPIRKIYNRVLSTDRAFVAFIRTATGVTPRRVNIYRQAFKHRSIFPDSKENNERLELLGDAVIDMLVAEYLYLKYPYREEGFITELRSKIVNRNSLNDVGKRLGLTAWVEFSKRSLGSLPKDIDGNTFEALIGAMYLDAGFDAVRSYFFKSVLQHFVDVEGLQETDIDFKSKIYHYVQRESKQLEFKLLDSLHRGRRSHFVIQLEIDGVLIAKGEGQNKKLAEQNAAMNACKILLIHSDKSSET